MTNKKIAGEKDVISGWTEEDINNLELSFLHRMFDCKEPEGVDVTVTYAKYMSKVELDPDNYPIFLKLLQFENHWVIDALLGDKNPEVFFKSVQPNTFILKECFQMLKRWKPNGIYPKSLLILFGLLKVCYENPHEGYRLYPLDITDINNLGKHLDDSKDQTYPVNRTVLRLLDRIASLNDPGGLSLDDQNAADVASQANNIRGKFLDMTKHLNEAIPDKLLEKGEYTRQEISPTITIAKN